jgi:hypothetical protein
MNKEAYPRPLPKGGEEIKKEIVKLSNRKIVK